MSPKQNFQCQAEGLATDTPFDVKEALSNAAGGFLFGSVVKGTETLGDWAARKISGNQDGAGLRTVDADGSLGYAYERQSGPRMVDYGDQEAKARIMAEVGQRMAQEGKIVRVTDADIKLCLMSGPFASSASP